MPVDEKEKDPAVDILDRRSITSVPPTMDAAAVLAEVERVAEQAHEAVGHTRMHQQGRYWSLGGDAMSRLLDAIGCLISLQQVVPQPSAGAATSTAAACSGEAAKQTTQSNDWWGNDGFCKRFQDGTPDEHVLAMYMLGSRQLPPDHGGGPCSDFVAGPFRTLGDAFAARERWIGSSDQDGNPVIYEVRVRAGVVAYHDETLDDVEVREGGRRGRR